MDEQRAVSRNLVQLMTDTKQEAVRTVQRLHRNLGHPSTESLVEILESRGASSAVLEAARGYRCVACLRYCKPNKPAPANLKQPTEFGEAVQADVMWIKTKDRKVAVLSMVDMATKYQVATVITGERTEHLIRSGLWKDAGLVTSVFPELCGLTRGEAGAAMSLPAGSHRMMSLMRSLQVRLTLDFRSWRDDIKC